MAEIEEEDIYVGRWEQSIMYSELITVEIKHLLNLHSERAMCV
jgi:hypothetical protein